MSAARDRVVKLLFSLYRKAVQAVQTPYLIRKNLQYNNVTETLTIFGFDHDLKGKNVYLVGAGKAVFHAAEELKAMLGAKIKSGIVSVPHGMLKTNIPSKGSIEYFEGARNNLPDEAAASTTLKIVQLLKGLDDKSVVLALITGGGSALLPLPIAPITLEEKQRLIKDLSRAGTDIVELNTVRKKISAIKGGKLSLLAYPAEIISIYLIDIIGSAENFVAGGPTFVDDDKPQDALNVIKKFNLEATLPDSIRHVLSHTNKALNFPDDIKNNNYVLGNNLIAVDRVRKEIVKNGNNCTPLVVSCAVSGDVNELSSQYCQLIDSLISMISKKIDYRMAEVKMRSLNYVQCSDDFLNDMKKLKNTHEIYLLLGGEPTVKVTGPGIGGRSQELALKFSIDFDDMKQKHDYLTDWECFILCAGTDGIDGPTDAAGAIGSDFLVREAVEQNLNPNAYLNNNDSYSFFEKFHMGKYHIKTGHTHTNVMDVHIIKIMKTTQ